MPAEHTCRFISRNLTVRHLLKVKAYNDMKNPARDFPGGPVVKNLPSNTGDAGTIPGQGTKIPPATGQLSLHTATTEALHSGACMP